MPGTWRHSTTFAGTVSACINGIWEPVMEWWDGDGKRIWGEIVGMFQDISGRLMSLWNDIFYPVFGKIMDEIQALWEKHLSPLWSNLLSFFTFVWDKIQAGWDSLKPFIDWIVNYVGPAIGGALSVVASVVGTMFGVVADVVNGIITTLKGVIDFVCGVFSGNWELAWKGISDIFRGLWDGLVGILKGAVNLVIDALNLLITGLYAALRAVVDGVGKIAGAIGDLFGKDWHFSLPKKAPQIPKLAEGGYVRANTPQLALIGDNRHQGEVVSPEGKLQEMALNAARMAGGGNTEILQKIAQIAQLQADLLRGILEKDNGITGKSVFDSVRRSASAYSARTGKPAFGY